MENRQSLVDKIKALLSKTMGAGCTEQEAAAALAKARAMIDVYEISDAELEMTRQEKAEIFDTAGNRHDFDTSLVMAISEFSGVKCWRSKTIKFCGLRADVELADFLLTSLVDFGERELVSFLSSTIRDKRQTRALINGFVIAYGRRVSERLRALIPAAPSNSRALVVIQSAAIGDCMKANGIVLGVSRSSRRSVDRGAMDAGAQAGSRAALNRSVSGANRTLLA